MWTIIYATPTSAEADLVISFLTANGFHPLDLEMSPHISLGGADLAYYVEVPPEEADAAREVLKAHGYEKIAS